MRCIKITNIYNKLEYLYKVKVFQKKKDKINDNIYIEN